MIDATPIRANVVYRRQERRKRSEIINPSGYGSDEEGP
jgi:hypothetical protein